jgi:hypothetical protein
VHERRKSAMLTTTILNSIPQIDQIDLPHSTWVPGHCNVDSLSSKGEEKSSKPRCHTPQKPQHTRVGIVPISSPNTPHKDLTHPESSVRPHSCYRPKILQAKCNRKHRNLALCEPPTSGNPTSEMEGRELICSPTGSAIPRSDLAHASRGPQWLNHHLVKQGICDRCAGRMVYIK